ncbi:hypothetical protein Bpfe_029699 [Biomphalaria pfeifferi]|uniref:SSD domain-containing protein n=1 Tax=Biomphalaria pfeifferi TaxID=112525 RepID=A0AAD8AR59_BIOPF|nr:hypothetical protein Bpfe_029699 [Biomphalaria pfeifferi]
MMSITIVCELSVIVMTSMAFFLEPTKNMGWITAGVAGFSDVIMCSIADDIVQSELAFGVHDAVLWSDAKAGFI